MCGIIEESVGVDRNIIKLIIKVIPIMEDFVCTGYGISITREIADLIVGIGQGNIVLGNAYCNKSCFITNKIDRKKIRALIIVPKSKLKVRKIAVTFADNTSLHINESRCQQNIQTISDKYRKSYKATRGLIQMEKSFYYS